MKTKTRTILTALCLASFLTGASRASQEQLAASMNETRVEAGRTRDQLTATLAALTELTKQEKGDLRPAYQAFVGEIPKTEAAATSTRARAAWMQGDGLSYFSDWEKSIGNINNESLRSKSQKRLNSVQKSYSKVMASFQNAGEKFKPFLADLADIQKVLANDVTASGVKSLRSTVRDANWRYKAINATIDDALKEMSKMEKALSTEAK